MEPVIDRELSAQRKVDFSVSLFPNHMAGGACTAELCHLQFHHTMGEVTHPPSGILRPNVKLYLNCIAVGLGHWATLTCGQHGQLSVKRDEFRGYAEAGGLGWSCS